MIRAEIGKIATKSWENWERPKLEKIRTENKFYFIIDHFLVAPWYWVTQQYGTTKEPQKPGEDEREEKTRVPEKERGEI